MEAFQKCPKLSEKDVSTLLATVQDDGMNQFLNQSSGALHKELLPKGDQG